MCPFLPDGGCWMSAMASEVDLLHTVLNMGQHHSLKALHDDCTTGLLSFRQVGRLFLERETIVVVLKQVGMVL